MSKFVKLWVPAIVNGAMRQPSEGVLHLEDDEADRLIEAAAGEDVTADFTAEQRKEQPIESLTVDDRKLSASRMPPFDPAAENARVIAERQSAAAEPSPTPA